MLGQAGEHSAEDLLGSIAVPTLVVAAERDTFTPPDIAEGMAAAIPNAELEMLRGGSHAAPVEQPLLVELRIEKFLAERVGACRST
jgi:pimeloyl-ACP methyl ester carboxylesterase